MVFYNRVCKFTPESNHLEPTTTMVAPKRRIADRKCLDHMEEDDD